MSVLAAATERDGWDWLLFLLSVVAAVVAIVAFVYWLLEQRRRPEARIEWWASPGPDTVGLQTWPASTVVQLVAGEPRVVEIGLLNVGDRAADDLLWNFIVPDCIQMTWRGHDDKLPGIAGNPDRALGPSDQVHFYAAGGDWTPGNWIALFFTLTYQPEAGDRDDQDARIAFEAAAHRFNGHGRRWLPGLLPPGDVRIPPARTPWPPRKRWRRRLRWIAAEPRGRVACRPGVRVDVRELRLVSR